MTDQTTCPQREKGYQHCPKCKSFLDELICPYKSCTICLGDHGGYICDDCGWNGDIVDLQEAASLSEFT